MSDNLRIWEAVSKTDPRHTKKVNQRGGFTAISAHYQIMEATKQFGPIGEGWGYEAGLPILTEGLIFVPVTLWHGNRENKFGPMFGGAEWKDGKGRIDSDAAKKATTDGLTKLLSQLGFNADVFLGMFDDNKYVQQVAREFAQQEAEPKVPARAYSTTDRDADEERWQAWVDKEGAGFSGKDRQFLEDWKEQNAKYTNKLARAFPELSARLWTAFDLALDDAVASGRQGFTDLTAAG